MLLVLLRTKCVYERQKCNLRLQNSSYGLFPGLISLLPDFQNLSMEVALMMFDQVLLTGIDLYFSASIFKIIRKTIKYKNNCIDLYKSLKKKVFET